MHTFGRTRSSQAPVHYYRQRVNGTRWLPWQKVELDINVDHLLAGIHNRRLVVLWPQFLDKADPPPNPVRLPSSGDTMSTAPNRFWDIQLYWSEYRNGKWAPKVLSNAVKRLYQAATGGDHKEHINFRLREKPQLDARLYYSDAPGVRAPKSREGFHKSGKQIDLLQESTSDNLIAAQDAHYEANLLVTQGSQYHFYYNSIEETRKAHPIAAQQNAASIHLLRNVTSPGHTVLDSRAGAFAPAGQFFFWDSFRTYSVDYLHYRFNYYTRSGVHREDAVSSFPFSIHYHPFVELFAKELSIWGIKGLLNRQIQVNPASVPGSPAPFDFNTYQPTRDVAKNYRLPDGTSAYPVEDVDFSYTGAYSPYNWELFFHVPFFIANRLSTNQRFEEALAWYHYIFDPTSTDTVTPDAGTPQQKYWITKPFYETTKADYYQQKIENLLLSIAKGDAQLQAQVEEWRDNPFKPHLIARMRTVAYQKAVLIKYIQTLIAWGDQLFRRDTIETINEATQIFVLAASILGPRPKSIRRAVPNPVRTLYQLERDGIDDFGNVLKQVENLLPSAPSSTTTTGRAAPELPRLNVLYFCIPHNAYLLALWDKVEDRLFKIRHCINIEGVVRQLPLYEPPIEPGLLVKAAASGVDMGSILGDINASLPLYRFDVTIGRALDMAQEVRALGAAMQNALAAKDAEAVAQLRSSSEIAMMDLVRLVKAKAQDDALKSKSGLIDAKNVVQARTDHYARLIRDGLNAWEIVSATLASGAIAADVVGTVLDAIGTGTSLIPDVSAGAAGFGGSPTLNVTLGGRSVTSSLTKAAQVSKGIASALQMGANLTSTGAGHDRRNQEWEFQKELADKELPQLQNQIDAAEIRCQMTQQDLINHDKEKENAEKVDEFLRNKFTRQELYNWSVNQLSTVFVQSYQLAFDMAKQAERSFRYELGLSESSYIQFGYWDSLMKGLMSGEKLLFDLKRLQAAYHEQNRREYELVKHVSLSQLDPVALLQLKQNGQCFVSIPETLFDLDFPGHYFRRIKTVRLSVPCVAGPYTTVGCTLTLVRNSLRKDATLLAGKYERDTAAPDLRFRDDIAAIQSIATSSAQDDSGMFELNFRDERYLPFEGAGAISSWQIRLNRNFPQFDLSTISDVVITLGYTARDGGDLLASRASQEFSQKMNALALAEDRRGLFRIYDLRREYPDQWYRFLHPASADDDQQLALDGLAERLPYFTRAFASKKASQVELAALTGDAGPYRVMLSPLGDTDADLLTLQPEPVYQGLSRTVKDLTGAEVTLDTWTLKVKATDAEDFKSLPPDAIEELYLIVRYTIG
ncbi:MAG: neuraminidase-like domain-containing protein [Pseudoxanthomonas sp.]